MRDPIIGIDLGTTNSVAAVAFEDGATRVLADDQGFKVQPSVVSFHPNGTVVVGDAGKQRRVIDPANTIYSVKRIIGRTFRSPEVTAMAARVPFKLKEGVNQQPVIVTRGGEFAIPEISAIVLDHIRGMAQAALGEDVARAVVTVPANFTEAQRSATATAGAIAGVTVVRVLNEPTAAALAYGHRNPLNNVIAVYDFGGGTFDVTLLRMRDRVYEVLGTAGDSFLGGDDIDERLVDHMVQLFMAQQRIDLRPDEVAMQRLRAVAEQTKIELSRRSRAIIKIDEIAFGGGGAPLDLQLEITRDEMIARVADIVDRTFGVCQQAVSIAGVQLSDIGDVVLVGGSTKMPFVRQRVAEFFGRAPRTDINPEEAIAVGAALQGQALGKVLGRPLRRETARSVVAPPAPPMSRRPATAAHVESDKISAPRVARDGDGGGSGGVAAVPVPRESTGRSGRAPLPGRPAQPPAPGRPGYPIRLDSPTVIDGPNDSAEIHLAAVPDHIKPLALPDDARSGPVPAGLSGGRETTSPGAGPMRSPERRETLPGRPVPGTSRDPGTESIGSITALGPLVPSLREGDDVELGGIDVELEGESVTFVVPDAAGLAPAGSPRDTATGTTLVRDVGDGRDDGYGRDDGDETTDVTTSREPGDAGDEPTDITVEREPRGAGGAGDEPTDITTERDPGGEIIDAAEYLGIDLPDETTGNFALGVPIFPDDGTGRYVPAPPPRGEREPEAPLAPPPAPGRTLMFPPPPTPGPSAQPPRPGWPSRDAPGAPGVPVPGGSSADGSAAAAVPRASAQAQTGRHDPADGSQPVVLSGLDGLDAAGQPMVLDVLPHTLGIATVAGYCEGLIRRNARVPTEVRRLFSTSRDQQRAVRIRVCQGESRRLDDNVILGDLVLEGLEPRPRGQTQISVAFQIDASGILHVRAVDVATGREQRTTLQLHGALSPEEVEAAAERMRNLRVLSR